MAEPEEVQATEEVKEVNPELAALKNEAAQKRIKIKELEAKLSEYEEAQTKKQEQLLKEQNKWKELYEKTLPDVEAKKEIESKYNELLKHKEEQEAKRRESLLSKLPEDTRDLFANMELDKLEILVEKQVPPQKGDTGKSFGKGTPIKAKNFREWKNNYTE